MKIDSKIFFIVSLKISLIAIIIPLSVSSSQSIHRIKSVECISLDNKSLSVDFCFVKAYSRQVSTLNLKFDFHRKFPKPIYIQYILGRKNSGNFCQNIFKSDLIEFCELMEGVAANPMIQNLFHLLNDTAPQLFQKCPYQGSIIVTNATFDLEKSLVVFPSGLYCTELNSFDDKKKQVTAVKLTFEIKNGFNFFGLKDKRGN
ncbi:unnamed protein product [Chironomus riparius]|uniref:Uncharacterized protein n=1 Tax=Chironomus riparius TaxID=315576 RepID=A0A9N9S8L2_9DIPT|nr:unnamed protein product [Chironomus riparius]